MVGQKRLFIYLQNLELALAFCFSSAQLLCCFLLPLILALYKKKAWSLGTRRAQEQIGQSACALQQSVRGIPHTERGKLNVNNIELILTELEVELAL